MTEHELASNISLYGPEIRRFVERLCPAALVDDVLSLTWQNIWQNRDTFDESRGNFPAYAKTIARCRAIDEVRALSVRLTAFSPYACPVEEQYDLPAPATLDNDQLDEVQRVRMCLNLLPPAQAIVLRMVLFDQLTFAEIAERLVCPKSTAQTRYSDGLVLLRRYVRTVTHTK